MSSATAVAPTTVDAKKLEDSLRTGFTKVAADSVWRVSCPDKVGVSRGSRFICTVRNELVLCTIDEAVPERGLWRRWLRRRR